MGMLTSALREVFGVQLYKNNAHALFLRILSFLNSDWLQHVCSVCGVYVFMLGKAEMHLLENMYVVIKDT